MRVDRLLGVLSILADRDKITIGELAARFEVTRRTIARDLDALNQAGIPIVSYPGPGGGVALTEGCRLDSRVLSRDDKQKLFTALKGLKSIDNDPTVTNLMAKLVPEQEAVVLSKSNYVIDLSSWFRDSVVGEKISRLNRAVNERRCVRLTYLSRKSRSERLVEPHKLIFKQSDWYLYAYCRRRREFRLFKVRRIMAFTVLEEAFQRRAFEGIPLEKHDWAGIFSAEEKPGLTQVVLEYDREDEFALSEVMDASFFQRPGEASRGRVCFWVSDMERTADYVFGFLHLVRVVSPPGLREEMKGRLQKILFGYET